MTRLDGTGSIRTTENDDALMWTKETRAWTACDMRAADHRQCSFAEQARYTSRGSIIHVKIKYYNSLK